MHVSAGLADTVAIYRCKSKCPWLKTTVPDRTNIVQAQRFREALEKAMLGYTNEQITTAEMITKLLERVNWVRDVKQHGHGLGLSTEEVAFSDALAENGSAREVMPSDKFRLMARKLSEHVSWPRWLRRCPSSTGRSESRSGKICVAKSDVRLSAC